MRQEGGSERQESLRKITRCKGRRLERENVLRKEEQKGNRKQGKRQEKRRGGRSLEGRKRSGEGETKQLYDFIPLWVALTSKGDLEMIIIT